MNDIQKKLLEAIRAGKDKGFGWDEIIEVLPLLGGKFEKKPSYITASSAVSMYADPSDTEAQKLMEREYQKAKSHLKKNPGEPSKVGDWFVTKVEPIKEEIRYEYLPHNFKGSIARAMDFSYKFKVAVLAYVVTFNGETLELKPGEFEITSNFRGSSLEEEQSFDLQIAKHVTAAIAFEPQRGVFRYDSEKARSFLRKQGWKEKATEVLGVGAYIPVSKQSKSNSATCGGCFGEFKVRKGKMVLHGYMRPGWGHIIGDCAGAYEDPYEVSPAGTKKHLQRLFDAVAVQEYKINRLKTDPPPLFEVNEGTSRRPFMVKHLQGTPSYNRILNEMIRSAEASIRQIKEEIPFTEFAIRDWRPRELPVAGQALQNIGHDLMTAYRARGR